MLYINFSEITFLVLTKCVGGDENCGGDLVLSSPKGSIPETHTYFCVHK